MSARLRLLSLFLVFAAACAKPMLWIGQVSSDGGIALGSDDTADASADAGSGRSGDASLERDAASSPDTTASTSDREAGVPPGTALPPRGGEPDASTPEPPAPQPDPDPDADDDADAGAPEPPEPPAPTRFPTSQASCPELKGTGNYTFGNAIRTLNARVYIAPDARNKPAPGGPLILFWHATGSGVEQVVEALGQAAIDDVVAKGGVVASFASKYCGNCGGFFGAEDVVWYEEDDIASDHLIACALEQARIDRRRIHSVGLSAGAMRSMHLALVRSDFIASIVSYSGGDRDDEPKMRQDPTNKVASIVLHGGVLDRVFYDFAMLARQWFDRYTALGWYTMICDHGMGHVIPPGFGPLAYKFLLDHPYKVSPEPYANGVPSEFPDYCTDRPLPP